MDIKNIHPRSPKFIAGQLRDLVRGRLWLKVLIGMAVGILLGLFLGPSVGLVSSDAAHVIGNWLALPGHFFLAILQMIVVPLVFASIIKGIAGTEDLDQLKRIGLRAILFFVFTTIAACGLGIVITKAIKPGLYLDEQLVRSSLEQEVTGPVGSSSADLPAMSELPEKLIGLLPQNPLMSLVERQMLQVVLFAIVVGMALVSMPVKTARPIM